MIEARRPNLFFDEERVGVALLADGGREAVTGMYDGVVRKGEKLGDE